MSKKVTVFSQSGKLIKELSGDLCIEVFANSKVIIQDGSKKITAINSLVVIEEDDSDNNKR